jgi:hypothetical protein
MIYIKHWTIDQTFDSPSIELSPRSKEYHLIRCSSCNLHHTYYVGPVQPNCIIYTKLNDSFLINIKYPLILTRQNTLTYKILQKLHPILRVSLTYNDYLARTKRTIIPLSPPVYNHVSLIIKNQI